MEREFFRQHRGILKLTLKLIQTAAILAIGTHLHAKDPTFPIVPGGFRIGMEIELLPDSFRNITGYFDYDKLQAEKGATISSQFPSDFLDDYLRDNPKALGELPEPLRAELTRGLQLEQAALESRKPLITSDGKPMAGQP